MDRIATFVTLFYSIILFYHVFTYYFNQIHFSKNEKMAIKHTPQYAALFDHFRTAATR